MTMTILEWRDSLLDVGAVSLPKDVESDGAFTALIGSRPAYAKVRLKFECAETFSVDLGVFDSDPRFSAYARYSVYGALDILMTSHVYAISKIKIIVVAIEDDEVTSTSRAFRLAGRDAAWRALVDAGLVEPTITR